MNRMLLTVLAFILISASVFAQVVMFSDNFDSYLSGQQLACQNPTNWTTWNLSPCDPTTDAYVTSTYAHSGQNSFVTVADNDEVHVWSTLATSHKWQIDFYDYIPTGHTGYFNTLANFSGGNYQWGMEVYFNPGGAGQLNAAGVVGVATFTYLFDTWVLNRVVVDLGTNQAWYYYNGALVFGPWTWTLGSGGGAVNQTLEANDFYGNPTAPANDQHYIDDYVITDLTIVPVELTSFSASTNNENDVVLNWSTATETNNHMFEIQRRTAQGEFFTIGYVNGAGTTTEPQNYSYTDKTVESGKYFYRLKQIDFSGSYQYSNEVEIDVQSPVAFNLEQNYPNPFNPSTIINYSVPEAGNVRLSVYNTVGEEIAVLVNGYTEPGKFNVAFDASNLPSGVYLYKLQSANTVQTKKMMLLK